jgi:hypothetical protein
MAYMALSEIIGTAVIDPDFRGMLLTDPGQVLPWFDLTTEERHALRGIRAGTIEEFAEQLLHLWAKPSDHPTRREKADARWEYVPAWSPWPTR